MLQQVTTYKPVWETEYRDQQTVVRRAIQQPVWQDQCYVVYRPVTTQPPAYGCCLFSRGLPQTQMVPQVVRQRSLGYVTSYADQVVTQKVPVQVKKMVAETRTIEVPRSQQVRSVPMETSYRPVLPSNQGIPDNSGWVRVDGQR